MRSGRPSRVPSTCTGAPTGRTVKPISRGEPDLGCACSSTERPLPPTAHRSSGPKPVVSIASSQPCVSMRSAYRPAPATCTT